MLARLDALDGVAAARVDWTGARFLLALDEGASAAQVTPRAVETLGEGARLLDAEEERSVVRSFRAGEAWMRSGETLRLSRFEADVLARRHGGEAARALGLDEARSRGLIDLIRRELERAFERMHAGEGLSQLDAEFDAAARRVLDASRGLLSASEHRLFSEHVRQLLMSGE